MKTTRRTSFATSASCLMLLLTLALPAAVQAQFTYVTNSGGTITITHIDEWISGELIIPNTTNGLPVTHIGTGAGGYLYAVTSITIPDSVVDIAADAFHGAGDLASVTIGNGVTNIAEWAFAENSMLTNVTLGSSVAIIGDNAFAQCWKLTSVTLPNSVTSLGNDVFLDCFRLGEVTMGNNITNIGNSAFSGTVLTNVTIPDSVIHLGDWVFEGSGLYSVILGNGAANIGGGAFSYCYNLTNVTIPNGVLTIGWEAFLECPSLPSIIIPDSVTSLGDWSFANCWGLSNITIGTSVTNIGYAAFAGAVLTNITIPDSVTVIGREVFNSCTNLNAIMAEPSGVNYSSVDGVLFNKSQTKLILYPPGKAGSDYTVPSGVTSIESGAFDSTSLTNITIPSSVTNIGDRAFFRRTSLSAITVDVLNSNYSSVDGVLYNNNQTKLIQYPAGKAGSNCTIPNSVTSVEHGAFDSVTNLRNVTIPNSVTNLGVGVFAGCPSLTNVTLGNSLTDLASDLFRGCTSLTGITIPNSVTSIGSNAFMSCQSLTSVVIPDSVATVGRWAFMNCSSLSSITLGNNITAIPYGMFMYCTHLASITIPNSVTSIGLYAFTGCSRMTTATVGNGVTNIGASAFYPCISLASVYFDGNAPDCGFGVFAATPSTVYYWLGTADWSNPWQGRPTVGRPTAAAHISSQPASQSKSPGTAATFTIAATGSAPLYFQWYKDLSPLANGGRVSGASTATLTVLGVTTNDEGSYTVTVTNLFGSDTSDPATLTMLAGETNRPLVSFVSPADKSEHTNNQITVTGKASDSVWLNHVLMSVNGGANAVIANPAAKSCNWTNLVTLLTGTNLITVRSVDSSGNTSAVASRTFFLRVPSTLTVYTNGNGSFTPTNYATTTNLFVGRSYTVTAKPGTNSLFTNWTASVNGGPSNHASLNATYTFLMQTQLTLVANFVTNRFIAAGGMYYGLFTDETTPIVAFERSGLFTLKTDSKQKFSGKLYLDGNTLSYSGLLDLAGYGVSKPIVRKGKAAVQVAVQLAFDGSDNVSGTVVALSNAPSPHVHYPAAFTSAMTGFKAAFNLTNNPATNLLGTYTMVMDVPANAESPKGNGYALITMKTNGYVTAAGYFGDYAVFMPMAVYISKDGDWPLYATAYKGIMPYQDKYGAWKTNQELNGMIWGWMKFTNNTGVPSGRELLDSSVDWIKYPNTNNFYPSGFTNHDLTVHASAFFAPTNTKSIRVLNIVTGNVVSVDGNLDSSMSNHFFMNTNSALAIHSPNVNTQTVTLVPTTGAVKGKFYHPNDPANRARVPLGAVLQDENIARGVFKGTNSTGSFLLQSD